MSPSPGRIASKWLAYIRPHVRPYEALGRGDRRDYIAKLSKRVKLSDNTLRRFISAAQYLEAEGITELPSGVRMPVAAVERVARIAARQPEKRQQLLKGVAEGRLTIVELRELLKKSTKAAGIVRFDAPPAVMAAGAFRPQYDFAARRVQNPADICCYVAMHLLAANGGAVLAFTWLRRDPAAEQFVRTFAALPREQMASVAVQCAFEHVEFTCMSDLWWSGLKRPMRAALLERVRRANSLAYRRSSRCLSYRIHFADWAVANIR
ncbi:hypothetical protein [Bradyrhizobium zhanjiangense]|uniref:hypothetical protein n=1 Tax=Bradyrhizobium zhanjiangense TaxID=1325107 RepID=UPI0013E8AB46|nr:hypothetical protein [Bradyrhizobium zhanjiangense]